jgi:hypothetical protein
MDPKTDTYKGKLIEELEACDNPYVLRQVEVLLKRENSLNPLKNMVKEFPLLLEDHTPRDFSLRTRYSSPSNNPLSRYDSFSTPIFFFISLIMLMLGAAIINAISHDEENLMVNLFQANVAKMYGLGWLLYLADFSILIAISRRTGQKMAIGEFIFRMSALIFPPLRMASRHIQDVGLTWLPFYGWAKSNEGLLVQLKRKFSIPMIIIALLIIPVLLVEWKFYDEVSAYLNTDLSFVLDMVQAFIWMAFAFEFILMFSITNEKVDYIKNNWIDVFIILLPFIAFIRTLRLIKIARLSQLARGYKLRGLLMKARQGFVFASFFYRILTIKPNFQIKNLKKKLEKNQKEREAIEEDLVELYKILKE